jgi:hypothetical protein
VRLTLVALISWLVGALVHLGSMYFIYEEPLSTEDLMGVGGASWLFSLPIFFLIYTPALFGLRRRPGGCHPAHRFPLVSFILTVPVLLLLGLRVGESFSPGEAMMFMLQFSVAAICFGIGFVWSCREKGN